MQAALLGAGLLLIGIGVRRARRAEADTVTRVNAIEYRDARDRLIAWDGFVVGGIVALAVSVTAVLLTGVLLPGRVLVLQRLAAGQRARGRPAVSSAGAGGRTAGTQDGGGAAGADRDVDDRYRVVPDECRRATVLGGSASTRDVPVPARQTGTSR